MRRTRVATAVLTVLLGVVNAAPAYAENRTDAAPVDAASVEPETAFFDEAGNVVGVDDQSATVTWEGEIGEDAGGDGPADDDLPPVRGGKEPGPVMTTMSCPEVSQKATYTLSKSRKFIVDKNEPWSTWLLPGQTVEYTTETSHEFSVSVTVGVSAEAGAFLAKASSKLDIQAGYKYTAKSGRKLSDTNKTGKGYRVRLGNQGFRLVETKTWYVPPCTRKSKVTWDVVAPEKGDLSFGRFAS